jgi:hypothetical protein
LFVTLCIQSPSTTRESDRHSCEANRLVWKRVSKKVWPSWNWPVCVHTLQISDSWWLFSTVRSHTFRLWMVSSVMVIRDCRRRYS